VATEREIQAEILRRCNRGGVRLFRNSCGKAWQGEIQRRNRLMLQIAHPRLISFGLAEGSGDLIGWAAGGRFASIEVKGRTGRPSRAQETWRDAILAAGGIAAVVGSVEEVEEILGLSGDHR